MKILRNMEFLQLNAWGKRLGSVLKAKQTLKSTFLTHMWSCAMLSNEMTFALGGCQKETLIFHPLVG